MVLFLVTAIALDEEGGVVYWGGITGVITQATLEGEYSKQVVDTRMLNLKSKIITNAMIP